MANQNTAMRNTARTAKAVATHLVRNKLNLATLKIQIIIAAIIILLLILTVFITGLISIVGGGNESDSSINITGEAQVSPEVASYRGAVFDELSKYDLSEFTELVLALMMQESGGKGNDPMQASESFCGSIGCITDPQISIEKGVFHFKNVLEKANKDVKLTLQSYNFGGGFIDYALANGGSYTKELAISFSQMMYEKLKHTGIYKCHRPEAIQYNACYGDIGYIDAVLRYLPSAITVDSSLIADGKASPLSRSLVVNSTFGYRIHPIQGTKKLHQGIDLGCTYTDSIHAFKEGEVVYAGVMSTYGNLVQIQHDGFITAYAHLNSINVSMGQQVTAGEGIGYCGTTGGSTGTHLHFEIKSQMWSGHIDPKSYLGL